MNKMAVLCESYQHAVGAYCLTYDFHWSSLEQTWFRPSLSISLLMPSNESMRLTSDHAVVLT